VVELVQDSGAQRREIHPGNWKHYFEIFDALRTIDPDAAKQAFKE